MFGETWYPVRDGDPTAVTIYRRHYPAQGRRPRTFQITGPGESLILLTACSRALFIWTREKYRLDEQEGICCSAFRNEGAGTSSRLILEAEQDAWRRWPAENRLFTFVNPRKVESPNPGYCFKMAGWKYAGRTRKRNLHILEKLRNHG